MLILEHLKTLQHVSIIIQIIIREFVVSLLKSLNLKFICQRLNVVISSGRVIISSKRSIPVQHTIQGGGVTLGKYGRFVRKYCVKNTSVRCGQISELGLFLWSSLRAPCVVVPVEQRQNSGNAASCVLLS